MKNKTVVIFGVFDGIHDGHIAFIKEAKSHGENLMAIVARDVVVKRLKGHEPKYKEKDRLDSLLNIPEVNYAFLGDKSDGEYNILCDINPSIVFLGYDQQGLEDSLNNAIKTGRLSKMLIIYGKPHNPEIFKSSIINNKP